MNKFKLVFTLIFLMTTAIYSQNKKNVDEEVFLDIKVEESIYSIKHENSYYTPDEASGIEFTIYPKKFEEVLETFNEKANNQNSEIEHKEVLILNGVKVLLLQKIHKQGSEEITITVYVKELNQNLTLVANSFYKKKENKKFKPLVEKAMLSAKIRE